MALQLARRRASAAQTIDELPLDWFFGPGVVLDMTAKEDGEAVETRRRRAGARADRPRARAGRHRARADGRDAFIRGSPTTSRCGPGVTAERDPLALRARRARDGDRRLGLGRAAAHAGTAAIEADEPGIFWAAHQADLPYAQIERLVELGELPATGFQVACFPLRIVGGERRAGAGRGDPAGLVVDRGQRAQVEPLVVGPSWPGSSSPRRLTQAVRRPSCLAGPMSYL